MGWLRDYMQAAQPPIASFGKLAAACLEHPQWPPECRPKPRSLSTLFSKLDRNQDLDWLRDRLEVQVALARLLGRPIGDLRAALGESADPKDGAQLRLVDVRYARSIDLAREDLPPGLPRRLAAPPSWAPCWWIAPSGSGKGLAALWLAHHGISHTAVIDELTQLERLPERGPLFLELRPKNDTTSVPELCVRHLDQLRAAERPLLIAAPCAPRVDLPVERLESPLLEDVLPELVDWVDARLDGSGHFQADRAERWMRQVALPRGAVRTWGDALGLLGLLDEVQPRTLHDKTLRELGAFFVKTRVRESLEGSTLPPALANRCFETLVDGAARALSEKGGDLQAPRPVQDWIELLSDPKATEVPDPEWLSRALLGALGHQVSKRDLERAAKKLQPNAFMVVRALEEARLLTRCAPLPRAVGGEDRRLGPRWLVTLLRSEAERRVLDHSSTEWGEFLLRHEQPETVVASLVARAAADDFAWAYRLAEEFSSHLAHVAALEATVLALGLSIWCGVHVPEDLQEDLQALVADSGVFEGAKLAAMTCPNRPNSVYSEGWYRVGWLALTRQVPFVLRHLDPYRADDPRLQQQAAVWLLAALPSVSQVQALHPTTKGLAVGLLEALDELCQDTLPACLVLVNSWETADEALLLESQTQCPLRHLFDLEIARGGSEANLAELVWRILGDEQNPSNSLRDDELMNRLWGHLPPHTLERRVRAGAFVPWSQLPPHVFERWLAATDLRQLPVEAAEVTPLDAVLDRLHESGPRALSEQALATLLARSPTRVLSKLAGWMTDTSHLLHLLDACPPTAAASLARNLPALDTLLKQGPASVDAVRRFLRGGIQERVVEQGVLFERLQAIESALRPLRKLP